MICTDDSSLEETLHSWLIDCNDDEFVPGLAWMFSLGIFVPICYSSRGSTDRVWNEGVVRLIQLPSRPISDSCLLLLPSHPGSSDPSWDCQWNGIHLSFPLLPVLCSIRSETTPCDQTQSRLWSQHIFNPTEINSFSFFHPGIIHQHSKSNNNTVFRSSLAHCISESLTDVTN